MTSEQQFRQTHFTTSINDIASTSVSNDVGTSNQQQNVASTSNYYYDPVAFSSGVAQLSCTDCSASCSSSSTASSDITDPGSPYSTSSSHGEDSNPISTTNSSAQTGSINKSVQIIQNTLSASNTSSKMPPHESNRTSPPPDTTPSPTKQPWPWDKLTSSGGGGGAGGGSGGGVGRNINSRNNDTERISPNILKRVTASKTTHTSTKRLKTMVEKSNNKLNNNNVKLESQKTTNDIKLLEIGNNTRKMLGKSVTSLCHILPKPSPFQSLLSTTSISPTLPTSNANPRTQAAPSRCAFNKNQILTQTINNNNNNNNSNGNNGLSTTLVTTAVTNSKTYSQTTPTRDVSGAAGGKSVSKTRGGSNASSGVITNLSSEHVNNLLTGTPQQGKITEYFKAQIKPPAISTMKKDSMSSSVVMKTDPPKTKTKRVTKNYQNIISNKIDLVKNQTGDLKKYLGLLSGSLSDKQFYINGDSDSLSVNSADLYRKIDVRTLTFQNQFNKAVKMDAKLNGKVSPIVSLTRKILPKPSHCTTEINTGNTQKKITTEPSNVNNNSTAANVNHIKLASFRPQSEMTTVKTTVTSDVNKITSSKTKSVSAKVTTQQQTCTTSNVMPIVIPTNLNTALPTVVAPKLNMNAMQVTALNNGSSLVKFNGAIIPIVKLNAVPIKVNNNAVIQSPVVTDSTNLSNNHNNNNNVNLQPLNIETALPTVSIPKSKYSPSIPEVTSTTTDKQLLSPKISVVSAESAQQHQQQQQQQQHVKIKVTDCSFNATNDLLTYSNKTERSISSGNDDSFSDLETNSNLLQISISQSHQSTTTTTLNSLYNHHTIESQKSPILSQPKTIRFPPRQIDTSQEERRLDGQCQWSDCHAKFETSGALLEHLQIAHVISQATKENFVCLWIGCKVHGRTSCSRSWLERHVLSHAGNKPYRCIVDGCGCRFNSQSALERHVNSHFNADGAPNANNQRKLLENGQNKKWKNGKKIKYRLQPWSERARMFDFFDAGIMEGLQHQLINMTDARTAGRVAETAGNMVTLRSRIVARRTETNGTKSVLLRWFPENVVADEWVRESEATPVKSVPIPGLEPSAINVLHTALFPKDCTKTSSNNITSERPRNRRKRVSSATKYSNSKHVLIT